MNAKNKKTYEQALWSELTGVENAIRALSEKAIELIKELKPRDN